MRSTRAWLHKAKQSYDSRQAPNAAPPHPPPPRTRPHRLEEGWLDRLLFQLRADCGLLEQCHIMDYSMLLGIHFRARGEQQGQGRAVNFLGACPRLAPHHAALARTHARGVCTVLRAAPCTLHAPALACVPTKRCPTGRSTRGPSLAKQCYDGAVIAHTRVCTHAEVSHREEYARAYPKLCERVARSKLPEPARWLWLDDGSLMGGACGGACTECSGAWQCSGGVASLHRCPAGTRGRVCTRTCTHTRTHAHRPSAPPPQKRAAQHAARAPGAQHAAHLPGLARLPHPHRRAGHGAGPELGAAGREHAGGRGAQPRGAWGRALRATVAARGVRLAAPLAQHSVCTERGARATCTRGMWPRDARRHAAWHACV